jgi:hypothetical protein
MPVEPWRLWRRIVVSFLRTTMGRDLGTNRNEMSSLSLECRSRQRLRHASR